MSKGIDDWMAEEREIGRREGLAEVQAEIDDLKAQIKAERVLRIESEARADRLEKALKSMNMLD